MNISLRTTTVLAAIALGAAIAPAGAMQIAAPPIQIESCSPVYTPAAEEVYAMGMLTQTGVEVDYVNRTAITAEAVTFRFGNTLAVDHGSFAPGAVIRHTFWIGSAAPESCRVAQVRFEGGTAYNADATAQNR